MKLATAFRLSLYLPFGLMVAAILVAVAMSWRESTVYRSTWCPPPAVEDGPPEAGPAVEPVQVLARLREIRWKFQAIHELSEADESIGSAGELDLLIRDLISDYDVATTPTREPNKP